MRNLKLLSIFVISAFAFVTIHTSSPAVVIAQEAPVDEVSPDSEYLPESESQYPTIEEHQIDDDQDDQKIEPDNSEPDYVIPDDNSMDENSEITQLFRGHNNRG
jgi:hypothetical protein